MTDWKTIALCALTWATLMTVMAGCESMRDRDSTRRYEISLDLGLRFPEKGK